MANTTAGDYVTSIGARIVRSISGFDAGDVLVQSGLDPRLFAGPDDQIPSIPYMLWLLDSGDWVGVSQATVGYNGTGCEFAENALTRAGVPERAAREIVRWRFCDRGRRRRRGDLDQAHTVASARAQRAAGHRRSDGGPVRRRSEVDPVILRRSIRE